VRGPVEVICHGDFAPHNETFEKTLNPKVFKKTPTTGSKIAKMLCKMPKNQVLFSGFLPLPNYVFLKRDFFDTFNGWR
jgi:hypothetical protein